MERGHNDNGQVDQVRKGGAVLSKKGGRGLEAGPPRSHHLQPRPPEPFQEEEGNWCTVCQRPFENALSDTVADEGAGPLLRDHL